MFQKNYGMGFEELAPDWRQTGFSAEVEIKNYRHFVLYIPIWRGSHATYIIIMCSIIFAEYHV